MKLNILNSIQYSIVLLALLLSACAGTKSITKGKIFAEPEYMLSEVRFVDIDMERMRLEVDLEVTNPNYLALEFDNVNYQLQVDGARVLSGSLKDTLKVPAKGSVTVTIPLELELGKLANGALGVMLKQQVDYALSAQLKSTLPILNKKSFTIKKAEVLRF